MTSGIFSWLSAGKVPRDLEHQRHRILAFLSDFPCVVQEKTEQGASGVVMNHQKIKSHA